ncbi:MAG: hypothetical protein ACTSSH_02565, partial [Candidatus Heimdallarchaeota archaeon]
MHKKSKLIMIPMLLMFSMLVLPLLNGASLDCPSIGVSTGLNEITITTEKMTLKIDDYKPNF